MKKEAEVRAKLKDAKYKYLKYELKQKMGRCPGNCVYNHSHQTQGYEYLPNHTGKPVKTGSTSIGLCMYGAENPEEWPGKICDDEATAKACPYFQPKWDKEVVREDFKSKLDDDEELFRHYKDLAAMEWVLGDRTTSWDNSRWENFKYFLLYYWLLLALKVQGRSE